MNSDKSHLHTLRALEPSNNVNDIHAYLCATGRKDMNMVSRGIVALYEIAESEREYVFRRNKHGIFDETHGDRAEYKKCFFLNQKEKQETNKVELEYFLDLLYSISFSLYVGAREFFSFNRAFNQVPKRRHLVLLEFFLESIENFYASIDTMAVLVVLVSGIGNHGVFRKDKIDPHAEKIDYLNLPRWLENTHFEANFIFPQQTTTFEFFKALRNNRAHRPFLDWSDDFKIAGTPHDLMKVRSVAEKDQLFDIYVPDFLESLSYLTCEILLAGLKGALLTYEERYDYEMKLADEKGKLQHIHDGWSKLLA